MLHRRWPILVFVGWTGYVWATRIVNAWSASGETPSAKVISTVTAGVLLLGSVAVLAIVIRAARRPFRGGEAAVIVGVAGATAAVWAVRIPLILADGAHTVGFKVVHVVLGAISIGLAAVVWRIARLGQGVPVRS